MQRTIFDHSHAATCVFTLLLSATVASGQETPPGSPRAQEHEVQESAVPSGPVEYKVLATSKTSTMQKEMNDAAEQGYRFEGVMGGETAFGGKEVVVVMSKAAASKGGYAYKLLATSKTSTMQKELQDASDYGYSYRGQTVFETLLGGEEVVVILERDKEAPMVPYEYKLLATSKTSTMQKELGPAGMAGYQFVGLTVGRTAMGGAELVVITRKAKAAQ